MTSKDFIQAEEGNADRIILYREGLFWKAYERSAFAVCTQIRPFKPTKRSLKILGGGELVSIGFPVSMEEAVLKGFTRLAAEPKRLTLACTVPIETDGFKAWKASIPLTPARTGRPEEHSAGQEGIVTGLPAVETCPNRERTLCAIAERLRGFDLASSTLMECMLFISELKKMLRTHPDDGTI